MKVIETERLYLRELNPDDRDNLARVLSDSESMRFYPHPFSAAEVENWIRWNIDNYAKYSHGLWAVILKDGDTFIGDCGITMQAIGNETVPEIGFHIIGKYSRRGYASEAASACRDYAFTVRGYERVFSYTDERNIASRKVAEKIGMRFHSYFEKNGARQIVHVAVNTDQ